MRTIAILFVLGAIVSTMAQSAQTEAPLRIALDTQPVPFSFLDEKGTLTGFDVDFAAALCAEIKRKCEIILVPAEKIIPQIVAGNVDIAIAGMVETPERAKLVNFTNSYVKSHSIFIEKPKRNPAPTREGLAGKKIGVQAGSVREAYLNKEYGDIATIVPYLTITELCQALQDDKIDTALASGLSMYGFLKSDAGADFEILGGPIKADVVTTSGRIAVSKKLHLLPQQLNNAIQALRSNGAYSKIKRKYFDFDIY